MSISISGHHFKDSIVNGEQGDIEGATTQVKYENILFPFFLVQTIGNGSCSPAEREDTCANIYTSLRGPCA